MDASFQETATENRAAAGKRARPDAYADLKLVPVLFSGYRDVSRLRHDFPLVLIDDGSDADYVRSLTDIINDILREIAPAGAAGERLRRQVLHLEDEIRVQASDGAGQRLSDLWAAAENRMIGGIGEAGRAGLSESLRLAREALRCDGAVIGCDGETSRQLVSRARSVIEGKKARQFAQDINRLVFQLSEILKADFMNTDQARAPERLKQSVGSAFETEFDFEAMSRVLSQAGRGEPLPESRRQRIESTLSTLRAQRFIAVADGAAGEERSARQHSFTFTRCAQALKAFRERLPEMAELVKAMSIAALEVENRYVESRHDDYFASFGEDDLSAEDVASFPSYFVQIDGARLTATEQQHLLDILSSDMPVKILCQTDDILAGLLDGAVPYSCCGAGAMLGAMAMGLTSAFVLQSGGAGLYRVRDRIAGGMAFPGAALITVYGCTSSTSARLPAYVLSAAGVESRAFPMFVYDPAAGPDWASRLRIDDNPQPQAAWPRHHVDYEDAELQTVSADIPFTVADFAACDARAAALLTPVPRAEWNDHMIPLGDYLAQEKKADSHRSPYILMVDQDDRLHRVRVDERLVTAVRRFGERWRSLQELGGIDNSHASRLLALRQQEWEEQEKQRAAAAATAAAAAAAAAPSAASAQQTAAAPAAAEPAAEAEPSEKAGPVEEAFIETARCTTCNECTQLNNRMFAYNENMQAYIKDPDAGTFKDLVDAAERCQVSIIHPGKPRNANEPGLEDLVERAKLFN